MTIASTPSYTSAKVVKHYSPHYYVPEEVSLFVGLIHLITLLTLITFPPTATVPERVHQAKLLQRLLTRLCSGKRSQHDDYASDTDNAHITNARR